MAVAGQEETFWPLPISCKASVGFVLELPSGTCRGPVFSGSLGAYGGPASKNLRLFEAAIAPGFRASTRYVVFK
jgi:hypothetical protein